MTKKKEQLTEKKYWEIQKELKRGYWDGSPNQELARDKPRYPAKK
jgi:hypothetical protein